MASMTNLFELKKVQTNFPNVKITGSDDAQKFIRQFYGDDIGIFESMFILLLNQANITVGYAKISQGGIASTTVDVRLIAKYAVESLCSGIILAHNHPSGNLGASQCDRLITDKTTEALKLFDIKVLDHIIIVPDENSYYSFGDEGML